MIKCLPLMLWGVLLGIEAAKEGLGGALIVLGRTNGVREAGKGPKALALISSLFKSWLCMAIAM